MSEAAPLTGEPLAIDLVNTRTAGPDLLATTEQLRLWLGLEADRLPDDLHSAASGSALAAVRRIRDHTAAALEALLRGARPPASALRGLEAALAAAPARTRLDWDGSAVTATTGREGGRAERLAAVLAEAAVALLTDPSIGRLRRCEAEDCVLLFLPAHPRRRWCSPERCGNRVRVARYYERRKRTAGD
ncbi:CGNR zinc finger domain-containing protein [Glycomyces albidus]|jgi:predicted RNA-binding Zn ribbon-like protein|uniref:Zinc finger CGNR domain-containing protein n=1 Tax=Glycomyces albidus TaxID=2656774 RepID=A0A6L5GCS4_9ACTN|nr:CGNR zinc finger domain-containing protein [Glycomyces albidus]MQM27489.1 hypothetical protein [Glycomyces albidus]